jgi:hypothetical protein
MTPMPVNRRLDPIALSVLASVTYASSVRLPRPVCLHCADFRDFPQPGHTEYSQCTLEAVTAHSNQPADPSDG